MIKFAWASVHIYLHQYSYDLLHQSARAQCMCLHKMTKVHNLSKPSYERDVPFNIIIYCLLFSYNRANVYEMNRVSICTDL